MLSLLCVPTLALAFWHACTPFLMCDLPISFVLPTCQNQPLGSIALSWTCLVLIVRMTYNLATDALAAAPCCAHQMIPPLMSLRETACCNHLDKPYREHGPDVTELYYMQMADYTHRDVRKSRRACVTVIAHSSWRCTSNVATQC